MAGNTQNFLQVLNTTTASLTTNEQSKLASITQQSVVLNYWHISIANFENALNGRILQATLPGESSTTFEANFPHSEMPGTYFWMGYNLNGSFFEIIKRLDEVSGKIYIASSGNYFGIISLSPTKTILVKYDNTLTTNSSECGTVPAEEEEDDTVEDRGGCEVNNIRVLFLFTPAIAGFTPSPLSVSYDIISEINATCMASGMASADVHFQWAGTVLLPGFIESSSMKDDVDAVCENSTAKSLRNSHYADMVILLTAGGHTDASGRVKAIGASDAKAYAGVEIASANMGMGSSGLTGTHEMGHILGARHQRCSTCDTGIGECDILTWHHGFQVGTTWRTMMAQNSCPNPTRILQWSNPDKDFMGLSTGDFHNNNAKKIENRAGKVCCFRESPPWVTLPNGVGNGATFLCDIFGPEEVCNAQGYYPYQVTIPPSQGLAYPLTYVWEISETGIYNYTQVSTGSSWVLMNPATLPGTWSTLRLTITDAGSNTSFDFLQIHRNTCLGGSKGGEDRSSSIESHTLQVEDADQVVLTPNPVTETLSIKGFAVGSQLTILDMNGRVFATFNPSYEDGNELSVNLFNFSAGVYVLSIKKPEQESPIKIRFVKL